MILLNQPYSIYERELDRQRRRETAIRAVRVCLFCAACICLGIGIGCLIRF